MRGMSGRSNAQPDRLGVSDRAGTDLGPGWHLRPG
jgi:hypothetical protein